jgi:hypothetical protein
MGINIEFNPELCLRDYNSERRLKEECVPETLEIGKTYPFLKKGQRNFWLHGEIALRETKGNGILSRPIASIIIIEATHFLQGNDIWTKGIYRVIETYDINDTTIHFETTDKINNLR